MDVMTELMDVQDVELTANEPLAELNDLQLAMIGGGIGDVIVG